LGGLVTGGSYAAAPAMQNATGMGIRAYHGSPHDFDRFDLSKIGTGEGAQAYGHGLYFADKEATAKAYRDTLEGKGFKIPNDVMALPDEQRFAILRAANAQGAQPDPMDAAKRAQWASTDLRSVPIEDIADKIVRSRPPPGRMYEVNINAKPEQFLDWDKPLSKQPGEIRGALANLGIKHDPAEARAFDDALLAALTGDAKAPLPKQPRDPMGSELYRRSGSVFESSSDPIRSAEFREAGIPGIKYLDQGSRAAGDGSRNYVLFDDKLIDILRKYGMAGASPLAALMMSGEADAQPVSP
jgi:hypothetical protein